MYTTFTALLASVALMSAAHAQTGRPVPDSIEGRLAAGKNAAGGRELAVLKGIPLKRAQVGS